MYAKVVTDLLYDGDIIKTSYAGKVIIGEDVDNTASLLDLIEFRLLDDDRIPYYEGVADDEALEPLFEWALHDSGVTIVQTKQKGEWIDTLN